MRIPKPVVAAVALAVAAALASAVVAVGTAAQRSEQARTASPGLWQVYDRSLSKARYIDLTHTITPNMPVWKGFGPAKFSADGRPGDRASRTRTRRTASRRRPTASRPTSSARSSTRRRTGRPSTRRSTSCPPTYAVRPLVVISIVPQVKKDPNYALQVSDIQAFEKQNGRIPAGSVVMVRSDWSKKWTDDPAEAKALAADPVFPGVCLDGAEVPAPASATSCSTATSRWTRTRRRRSRARRG